MTLNHAGQIFTDINLPAVTRREGVAKSHNNKKKNRRFPDVPLYWQRTVMHNAFCRHRTRWVSLSTALNEESFVDLSLRQRTRSGRAAVKLHRNDFLCCFFLSDSRMLSRVKHHFTHRKVLSFRLFLVHIWRFRHGRPHGHPWGQISGNKVA